MGVALCGEKRVEGALGVEKGGGVGWGHCVGKEGVEWGLHLVSKEGRGGG